MLARGVFGREVGCARSRIPSFDEVTSLLGGHGVGCSLPMRARHGNQQFLPMYKMQIPDVVVPWRRPIFDKVACPSKGTYPSTAICVEFGVALPVLYPKSEPTRTHSNDC
jgi:hypothetical protein